MEVLQRDNPDRTAIHTDTAVDNHAMQATNRDFGYRPVERPIRALTGLRVEEKLDVGAHGAEHPS